jgi:hypothetical protein
MQSSRSLFICSRLIFIQKNYLPISVAARSRARVFAAWVLELQV